MSAAVVNTSGETKQGDTLIDCNISEPHYGKFKAVRDVAVKIGRGTITAFIGPSGCGKSTALRCLNRMNDLVRGFRLKGHVIFRGRTFTPTGSIRSPFGVISECSFSSRIRSR
jgi:ABC-type phosphate transport system ATPase subunit